MGKLIDLSGNRYGKMLVLSFSYTSKTAHSSYYLCKCDCGNEKIVLGSSLKLGKTRSCGCLSREFRQEFIKNKLRAENKLRPDLENSTFIGVFNKYKCGAKMRKLEFLLDIIEFLEITEKNCFYCNKIPSNLHKANNGYFVYSGIDRIDNDIGYIQSNCVPCCKTCNMGKTNRNINEFYKWVKRIYEHKNLSSWGKH